MIARLCFVTDADAPLSIPDQAERAARGGAEWVQLRHKTLDDQSFAELARAVGARVSAIGATLILNDRVDLVRAVGAGGLHIGQSDGDPAQIRGVVGPDCLLGLSIEDVSQLAAIPRSCVTYLGVGPVRATRSKPDHAAPLGMNGLARIVHATDLPCIAIGGLTAADVPNIRNAGCAGIAVVSAISRASAPDQAARAFLDDWSAA